MAVTMFVALLAGALPFHATAQTDIAQSNDLKIAVDSLQEKADSSRDTLLKVFDVTLAEIKELLSKEKFIQAAADKDEAIAAFAQTHLDTLKSHEAYIELLTQQASDEVATLDDVKNIAVTAKEWRATIYEPNTKEIFALLLFLQARSVVGTATSRLTLITADLKKLNAVASRVDNQALAQFLVNAQKNIKNAKANLEAARVALLAREVLEKKLQIVFLNISTTYGKIFLPMSRIAQKY